MDESGSGSGAPTEPFFLFVLLFFFFYRIGFLASLECHYSTRIFYLIAVERDRIFIVSRNESATGIGEHKDRPSVFKLLCSDHHHTYRYIVSSDVSEASDLTGRIPQ